MNKSSKASFLQLEILWWLITFLIGAAILLPIYIKVVGYPFYLINIIFIVTFITLTRYIFFLPFTFLGKQQTLKIILFFLSLPFVFYLIQSLNQFQLFLDEEGPQALINNLEGQTLLDMTTYIRSEIILFGVGSVISAILFPFRLLKSVWRFRNRGTV